MWKKAFNFDDLFFKQNPFPKVSHEAGLSVFINYD